MMNVPTIVWFVLLFVPVEITAIDSNTSIFYIELLQAKDTSYIETAQRSVDLINKNLQANNHETNFEIRLGNDTEISDMPRTASRLLKSHIIAMIDFGTLPYYPCTLSTVTKLPLLRIHGNKKYLMDDACNQVITMSANYETYARATIKILDTFHWKKIAFMFQRSRFYEVAYFKSLSKTKDYTMSYIQVDINSKNTQDDITQMAMKELASTSADVILFYVDNGYFLLNKASCYFTKSSVWIIQDLVRKGITVRKEHKVISFRLHTTTLNDSLANHDESSQLIQESIQLVANELVKVHKDGLWLPGNDSASLTTNRENLYRYIKGTSTKGISFDNRGSRLVEKILIDNVINNTLIEIGSWTQENNSLELQRSISSNAEPPNTATGVEGRKFIVIVVPNPPYVMKDSQGFFGLCIDLLDRIAADLKFTYEIHEQVDRNYGMQAANGKWDGMMGAIISKKADMIVGDLTRTTERQKYVSLTAGFMYYTDKLLMKKSVIVKTDYLQFMSPMSLEVWVVILAWLVVVTFSLYMLNYFSPYGKNEHGSKTSEEFNLINCAWFSISCMLQQGADHSPRSISGRVLAGFFWFTIMVWVATYTANLVAFFTVKNEFFPVTDLRSALRSNYKMGVRENSLLHNLFTNTEYDLYKEASNRLTKFANTTSQALDWVREGDFIYITEGPFVDFIVQRKPCDLMTVRGLETPRTYVFALRLDDPHVNEISVEILRLRENGYILYLKDKYLKGTNQCPTEDKSQIIARASISLKSMLGVFMVLGAGTALSFITLFLERCWYQRRKNKVIDLQGQ